MKFSFLISVAFLAHVASFFTAPPRTACRGAVSKQFLFGNPEPAKKEDKGMFGGMGNMMDSMKKAQDIAKQAELINKELTATIVIGNDPSQQVSASFNGIGMPLGIKVSDALAAQGGDAVSAACTQAMIDGHTKSQSAMMMKMQALYSGAGLPN